MAKTTLTAEQFREATALGGAISEVRDLANDGYSFDEIKDILESQQSARESAQDRAVNTQADANAAALNKDKIVERPHPGKSVYSYPEGDRARPRPKLPFKTIWIAEELGPDHQTTARELELAAQLQPGKFVCKRSDGSNLPVEIRAERSDVDGSIQKLTVWFETRGNLKHNLPTKVAMLTEMVEQIAARQTLVTA